MNSHGYTAREDGMVIYIRTAHFIDGVTALVYDGVEGRGHILLVVMGGNPARPCC